MDPTQNRQTHPGSEAQPGLFDDVERKPEVRSEVQPGVSADPKAPIQLEPMKVLDRTDPSSPRGPVLLPPAAHDEPLWARRLKMIIFVLFCIELGMLLAVLPWTRVWSENNILLAHPDLRSFMQLDFVRGAVTGLGLVDIWLGIREAVTYREQ